MSRRVSVHHFIAVELARPRTAAWRASDIFGASHWLDVPPDTEFPRWLLRVYLFTRFYSNSVKPTKFLI